MNMSMSMNMSMNNNVFNLASFIVTANEDASSIMTIGVCGLFILSLIFIVAHYVSEAYVNDNEDCNELENVI